MSIGIIQDYNVIEREKVRQKKLRRIEALTTYLNINQYNWEYLKNKGFSDSTLIFLTEKRMAYQQEKKKLEAEL